MTNDFVFFPKSFLKLGSGREERGKERRSCFCKGLHDSNIIRTLVINNILSFFVCTD